MIPPLPLARTATAVSPRLSLSGMSELFGRPMVTDLHAALQVVCLEMQGFVESLNVAAAAAVLLHKMCELTDRSGLPTIDRAAVRASWYRQLAHGALQQQAFNQRAQQISLQEQANCIDN